MENNEEKCNSNVIRLTHMIIDLLEKEDSITLMKILYISTQWEILNLQTYPVLTKEEFIKEKLIEIEKYLQRLEIEKNMHDF